MHVSMPDAFWVPFDQQKDWRPLLVCWNGKQRHGIDRAVGRLVLWVPCRSRFGSLFSFFSQIFPPSLRVWCRTEAVMLRTWAVLPNCWQTVEPLTFRRKWGSSSLEREGTWGASQKESWQVMGQLDDVVGGGFRCSCLLMS